MVSQVNNNHFDYGLIVYNFLHDYIENKKFNFGLYFSKTELKTIHLMQCMHVYNEIH